MELAIESADERALRLRKMKNSEKIRRRMEPKMKRDEELKQKRETQILRRAFICGHAVTSHDSPSNTRASYKSLNTLRREELWRTINQNNEPENDTDVLDLKNSGKVAIKI